MNIIPDTLPVEGWYNLAKGPISWKFPGLISVRVTYRDAVFSMEFPYVMREW